MPNKRAAVKAMRQSASRHLRNVRTTSELRTLTKKFEQLLTARQTDQARGQLMELLKRIDQAKGKGILHPNAASRKKSRLAARLAHAATAEPRAPALVAGDSRRA